MSVENEPLCSSPGDDDCMMLRCPCAPYSASRFEVLYDLTMGELSVTCVGCGTRHSAEKFNSWLSFCREVSYGR